MHFRYAVFTAVTLLNGLGFALPSGNENVVLLEKRVPVDTIDKYTVQRFLDNVEKHPEPSSCVFYTAGLTRLANKYAETNNKFTIFGVWNCKYYDRSQSEDNPLREILRELPDNQNTPEGQTYFEHMSEAYAMLCSGPALVLSEDPTNVRVDGIWGRIEFTTLQKTGNPGGQCDAIIACKPDGTDPVQYWQRPKSGGTGTDTSQSPARRQTAQLPNKCYSSPEELARKFADIDKLW